MYLVGQFTSVLEKVKPLHVVHVGAHLGEEARFYDAVGADSVIWFEGNPVLVGALRGNLKRYPKQTCEQALMSDRAGDKVKFFIANNGMSSSFLPLKEHLRSHPEVKYNDEIELTTTTLDDHLFASPPTVLNLDVQGAEIHVLRGATATLKGVQVIYAEINFREMYEGCMLIDDFDKFLGDLGFSRVATHDTGAGWGDAIYVRKT